MKSSISRRLPGSSLCGSEPGDRSGGVISKAGGDPALAAQCQDHLKQYLTLLFNRQFGAT
jgi:hypothetical protein